MTNDELVFAWSDPSYLLIESTLWAPSTRHQPSQTVLKREDIDEHNARSYIKWDPSVVVSLSHLLTLILMPA